MSGHGGPTPSAGMANRLRTDPSERGLGAGTGDGQAPAYEVGDYVVVDDPSHRYYRQRGEVIIVRESDGECGVQMGVHRAWAWFEPRQLLPITARIRSASIFQPMPDPYKKAAEPETIATNKITIRQEILDEARAIVSRDRNSAYGEPEANHARIAQLWTTFLEPVLQSGAEISPRQAALCMALVKLAREIHTPKRDNLVDLAGYAAVAGECS